MKIKHELISTAIDAIEYDTLTKILKVIFTSGNAYDYPGVPHHEVESLIKAESAGKYFNQHIRQYSAC